MTDLIFKRADLQDEKPISELLKIGYEERFEYKYPKRWHWLFVNNPFAEIDKLNIWIAIDPKSREVVGQSCSMPVPFKFYDMSIIANWNVDTYLKEEYRGLGLGVNLNSLRYASEDIYIALGGGVKNTHIKKKLGAKLLPGIEYYFKPLKFKKVFLLSRATFRKKWGSIVGSIVYQLSSISCSLFFIPILKAKQKKLHESINNIHFLSCPNEDEINKIWELKEVEYDISVRRTKDYIKWKYFDQPHLDYKVNIIKDADDTIGYLVYRRTKVENGEDNLLIISELVVLNDNYFSEVLTSLMSRYCSDADGIYFGLSINSHADKLASLGFVSVNKVPLVFFSKKNNLFDNNALEGSKLFFSLGDHDVDQVGSLKYPNLKQILKGYGVKKN